MPAPTSAFISNLAVTTISFALAPAHNILHSMLLLNKVNHLSGYSQWLIDTAASLNAQQLQDNLIVLEGLHYAAVPDQSWPSFPAYLDYLEQQDPLVLRDKILTLYMYLPCHEDIEPLGALRQPIDMLATLGTFLDFVQSRFGADGVDVHIETEAYALLKDPAAMQQKIVTHLRSLWENYFSAEWEQVQPLLQSSVRAFQHLKSERLSPMETAEKIIGQQIPERWQQILTKPTVEEFVFVPSAHLGPYMGAFKDKQVAYLFFGARPLRGVKSDSPDLNRSELHMRLNALADETRLHILQIISDAGELYSKDIMERLALSQSATSRHLKQLTAAGYLDEQWKDGAKCYRLSHDRIRHTIAAIEQFLVGY